MKNIKSILLSILILMMIFPIQAFGHEGEDHSETASFSFIDYSMIAAGVMAVIAIIMVIVLNQKRKSINVKSEEGQVKSRQFQKWMKVSQWVSVIAIVVLLITGAATFFTKDNVNESSVELMHIHGLGFTKDGSEIYVPAHDGLKVYSNGQWSEAAGEKHDYMGFSMVDDGFYSSGHPAPDSSMKNPFGIVRSSNMGEDLKTLGLYGEIDFHGMDVGYNNHAIYVFNPQENSQMDDTGIYYSLDDTKIWNKSGMKGIEGQVSAIAVHPDQEEVVAVSTKQGIFLSKDFGDTFEELSDVPTSALSFSNQGKLYAGSVSSNVELNQINIENGEKNSLQIPSLEEEDAIGYIAINPQNEQHIVISTFKKDIFSTSNMGENWATIAKKGVGSSINMNGSKSQTESQHSQGEHSDHGSNNNEEEDRLDVSWEFDNEPIVGNKQTLQINIKDSSGEPIDKFDIEHEKLMHLIIVSEDLSIFQHIHPEFKGNGLFKVSTSFPQGGRYKLIADVVPSGQETSTVTKWIDIDGKSNKEAVIVDESLTKEVDGRRISLSFEDQIQSNKDMTMTFTLKDDQTGESINDLKPYLGAIGHVVIVSEDGEQYVHSHPMNNETSGPEATFMTVFPERGVYKIWGQFNHKGKIVTVPFVVEVP
ncbi:MAG: F510_1955 family glycosylhydrolase [Bacillota bacterium]